MATDSDLIKLYSGRILALAAELPRSPRLDAATASAKRRSPLCGSTVTVEIALTDGVISGFAQDVKACALGQASAALVGQNIVGRTEPEVRQGRDQLFAMLKEGAAPPDAPFSGFDVLTPARDYKNRHASIMLAFEATLDAFEMARKTDCA